MNQDPNEGLDDSTESSLYSESTESRIPCNVVQPRQTARVLLEKRRRELPKMTPIEQAYMRNSRKQVPYHPLKQPAPSGILHTIKATHTNRIKQLENQVAEDQIKINEYVTELRTMKTQQKRLEMELRKYQGMAGNIPNFMRGQEEELRAVQHELKKAKLQNARLGQSLASREDELKRVKQENHRWRRLEDVMQLEDREKLFEQNEELKHQITRQNDKIMMLTRKGMLEVKNLKCELANERKKHRATQQSLDDTLESSEKLRSDLDLKQKYITYNSVRFASRQKKLPPNGLESISLITLNSNRFGGTQGPMRLDPELVRHYPKTPATAPKLTELPPTSSANENHRTKSALSERLVALDKSNHNPNKDVRNSPARKSSPPIPLPKIRNDLEEEEDDGSISEGSDMSEEDINIYSSSFGSRSKGETPVVDSRKSSLDFGRDAVEDSSGSDAETRGISGAARKNGASLPDLAAVDGNMGDGDGRLARATRERVPRGERRLSVGGEKSSSPSKSESRSPAEGGKQSRSPAEGGKQSRSPTEGRKQSRTPNGNKRNGGTREARLARDYAEIEERVKCEKSRGDAIRTQYEGYLRFDAEVKQEMDQASKGKLLAALEAIERGGDPVKMSPPPPPTVDRLVTEDLHRGRRTRRDRSPEVESVPPSALDLFKSDAPLDHPMTKSELIKELFGGGGNAPTDVVPPTRNNMAFRRVNLGDNNNNEPAETGAFYAGPRVSLTNWKH